ncbi:MAG: hypothetical protein IPK81_14535 [Rhodospirillales bacterium]|nr:MAG: hypothetical protein IPK81_14535 [Rhodospirillales bacterium]
MTEPIDEVRTLEAAGLFLSAYDRAMAALAAGADDDRLRHRAVLALARGGATRPALALFRQFGLRGHAETDIAALEGRLLKDLALRAGPARIQPLAARAAAAYTRVWRRDPAAPYPAINAASMSLLAGDRHGALEIARRVRLLQRDDGGYWAAATMAEASVLLGDADTARRHLEVAQARAGDDFAARATTRRQLRLVAAIMGIDPRIIDTLRVPKTIHYCGHMPEAAPAPDAARHELALVARIDRALAELDVSFAYGALAAGADILFVEALLRRGVRPTVVLPFDRETFVRESVLPYGAAWVARFERCVAKCDVPEPEGGRYRHDELDFGHGSRRAMGLARLHARRIDGAVAQVAAWDGVASAWEAGTASDVARWARPAAGR